MRATSSGPRRTRRDEDVVGGPVRRDDPAARVPDDAARRPEPERLRDVLPRDAGPPIVLHELQHHEAGDEEAEDDDDEERHPLVALLELAELATGERRLIRSPPPSFDGW